VWSLGVSVIDFHPFVERAPEYDVRDEVVCIDFGHWQVHMPLRVFRIAQARAAKVVRDHDASGDVVPFKGKRS
jgi:hypothetical protein